jgi:SAM-dependent methyltransferase
MSGFKFNPSTSVYEDMHNNEKDHWWYKGLRDLLVSEISSLKINKILDVGFGTGFNLEFLSSLNYLTYGLDISPKAINLAKSKGLKNIYLGNALDLPFENNIFDLVICMDIFGNFDNSEAKKALQEIYRVSSSKGYLVINTAALPWLYSSHDNAWDIKQRYTLEKLIALVSEEGFKIVKSTYRVSFLFPFVLIIRFLQKFNSNKKVRGDTHLTNNFLNRILYLIMNLENFFLRYINFPIGSSVFIVAQKSN